MAARKVNLNGLRQLTQYRSWINPEAIKKDIVRALEREGRRLIQLAYASRGFENRTKNLKDSYCYGVFIGKNLLSSGFLTPNKDATETNRGWDGREEAIAFLERIGDKIEDPSRISLVIGVGLFYGGILEAGEPPLRAKYRVLANIETDLQELAAYGINGYKYNVKYDFSKTSRIGWDGPYSDILNKDY